MVMHVSQIVYDNLMATNNSNKKIIINNNNNNNNNNTRAFGVVQKSQRPHTMRNAVDTTYIKILN